MEEVRAKKILSNFLVDGGVCLQGVSTREIQEFTHALEFAIGKLGEECTISDVCRWVNGS